MKNKDIHVLAFYKAVPKNPKLTSRPGYTKDPNNMQWEETINITRGLKDKDLAQAQVIINLNKKEIVRNTIGKGSNFNSILAYFQESYPKYINPVIATLYKDELNEISGHVLIKEEKESS